jgi:hypothetical protein
MIKVRDVFESDQRATEQMCGSLLRSEWQDENIVCVDHLQVKNGSIAIRGRNVSVSAVVSDVAGELMPAHTLNNESKITTSEWEACVRFTTLILISLESTTTIVLAPGSKRRKFRFREPSGDLIDVAIRIRDQIGGDFCASATAELRQRIIAMGSATECNVNCIKHIEIGDVKTTGKNGVTPVWKRGAKIKGKDIMMSDLMWLAERAPMSAFARRLEFFDGTQEVVRKLTAAELRACVRFAALILTSLEKNTWDKEM